MNELKWIFEKNSGQHEWYVLRRKFNIDLCAEQKLFIAAMSEYEVYINGDYVSRGPMRSYSFHKFYDEIDITRYLHKGENIIAILSLHLEYGGVAAKICDPDSIVVETDEYWKVKKYDALDSRAYQCSPPLEPISRCEEVFDANVDAGVFDFEYDDSGWKYADVIDFDNLIYSDNKGGLLTEDLVLPKHICLMTAVGEKRGMGIRLKNLHRVVNPMSKRSLELYFACLISPEAANIKVICDECTLYINGQKTEGIARLREGENFVLCQFFGVFHDPEFFIETDANLVFKIQKFGDELSEWGVMSLETSESYYAWAYPYDPFNGNNSKQMIESLKGVSCFEELPKEVQKSLNGALMLSLSTRFSSKIDCCYKMPGGYAKPEYKINIEDKMFDAYVQNEKNMLHMNADNVLIKGDVKFVFDFEEETFGLICFELFAQKGTVIEFICSEMVNSTGLVLNKLECMRYECCDGWQNYTAHVPRGMRYLICSVKNNHGIVKINHIGIKQTVACLPDAGLFECDDYHINRIYKMCLRSAIECMGDSYMDCPGFEQVYWLGDAIVPAMTNLVNFGGYEYDYNCLYLAAQSLTKQYVDKYESNNEYYKEGKYLVTPAFGTFVRGGIPEWSFMWLWQVYNNYMYSGNEANLKQIFPFVEKMLLNCENMMDSRGLFAMEGAWNLIEWASNDLLPCGEVTASNAWLAYLYKKFSYLALRLGKKEISEKYIKNSEAIKAAINKYCWNESVCAYSDSVRDEYGYALYKSYFDQNDLTCVDYEKFKGYETISEQTNTIMYLCDMVPENRLENVKKIICNITKEDYPHISGNPELRHNNERNIHDVVSVGSPFFFFYTHKALVKMGKHREFLDIIKRDYEIMLSWDVTTTWEGYPQPGDEGLLTRSACHGWGASPAVYLITDIAGIKPVEPGFKKFSLNPNMENLKRIRTKVPTPYGPIFVNIDKEKNIEYISYPPECEWIR